MSSSAASFHPDSVGIGIQSLPLFRNDEVLSASTSYLSPDQLYSPSLASTVLRSRGSESSLPNLWHDVESDNEESDIDRRGSLATSSTPSKSGSRLLDFRFGNKKPKRYKDKQGNFECYCLHSGSNEKLELSLANHDSYDSA